MSIFKNLEYLVADLKQIDIEKVKSAHYPTCKEARKLLQLVKLEAQCLREVILKASKGEDVDLDISEEIPEEEKPKVTLGGSFYDDMPNTIEVPEELETKATTIIQEEMIDVPAETVNVDEIFD